VDLRLPKVDDTLFFFPSNLWWYLYFPLPFLQCHLTPLKQQL
jgi:hypothetical protein